MRVEYFSEGYESITEGMSIIDPDISNSSTTGDESNACSSRGIYLIPKKGTKKSGTILDSCKNGMVVENNKPVLGFGKLRYPGLGRRRNTMEKLLQVQNYNM